MPDLRPVNMVANPAMIPNGHITIYNKYTDPTTRREKYQRTVIRDVVWQATRAISGAKTGQLASNVATIFIPFARGADYVKPHAWQALSNKAGKWTLQNDDVIARGAITTEITEAVVGPPPVPAYTMTNLRAANDDVVTITSVDAMDQGSPNMQHWQVGCK